MSSWWKARPDDADDSNAGPAKQPSDKQLDVVLFLYGSNFEVNHGIVKSFWVEKRHCKQQDDTMEFRVRVEIPRSIGKSVIDLQLIDAEESLVRGRKQQSLLGVPIWRCELTK